ncbi:DNA-3-methyladenine glycosylase family protein [Lapillicoccus sp.]|uniref:DNA-3-methyladenine glycosylase family protein n=1 Tax=Lapillicoccus sp. TaxID=1909287 RepID=UPI003983795E
MTPDTDAAVGRSWRSQRPVALGAITATFRRGSGDPTFRRAPDGAVVRAVRTPAGPASLELRVAAPDATVEARAWGQGAQWALEHVPDLLGGADDDEGFVAHHPLVAEAARRFCGWRVPRSGLVLDALVPAIIEQKVTGQEAFAGYRRLVGRFGDPAPGPYAALGLRLPPTAAGWAAIPSWEFLQASVDSARSTALVRAARAAGRLEQGVDLTPARARLRMQAVPGVGVWTSAEVAQRALGDADAVSYGDYHVARNIGWALTGQEVDDDGLAELLEPYAGHRYRVQRLLELAGARRPRHGARMAPRTHLPR